MAIFSSVERGRSSTRRTSRGRLKPASALTRPLPVPLRADGCYIVTGAFGAKYKPNRHVEIGVAWELPLTERRDILENRLTVDAILRY